MRLTFVLPELVGGGAERVFLDIALGVARAGHEVEVLTVRDGGALADAVPGCVARTSLGRGDVGLAVPALRAHLRRHAPDVVVSGLSHMNLATIAAVRTLRRRPRLVVTHHNHLSTAAAHATSRRDRLVPRLVPAYRLADRVVSVSRGAADDLAAISGLPRARIEVLPNPVRYDLLRERAAQPAPHPWLVDRPGPVVLGVGRLTRQKDFPTLLRAVALLPRSFHLLVLGEGEDRPALERLAAELGIADRVALPGFVANPYAAFARADVFALSSAWEGLPTVLMEALAFATPIVATDCPSGPGEILEGGRWGALVPTGDPRALATAIEEAVGLPPPDRAGATAPYELDRVVARYLEVLV